VLLVIIHDVTVFCSEKTAAATKQPTTHEAAHEPWSQEAAEKGSLCYLAGVMFLAVCTVCCDVEPLICTHRHQYHI